MTAMPTPAVLPRRLGTFAFLGTLVGIMIGSGIFRVPSSVAQHTGEPIAFMAVWVVGGLIAIAGALTTCELATMFPATGGRYVYLREGIHPVASFTYAVGDILFLRPVSISARALLIAAYLGTLMPVLAGREVLVAAGIIASISLLNFRSSVGSAGATASMAAVKFVALAMLAAALILFSPGGGAAPFATVTADAGITASGFLLALVPVMWTFSGWNVSTYMVGEVRDPARAIPRAIIGGVLVVTLLFLAVNWGYLRAMPLEAIAGSDTVAADSVTTVFGTAAGRWLSVFVVVSVFGSLMGSMLAMPRLPFALGNDVPRLRMLAVVHRIHQTPHAAVVVTALLAIAFLAIGSFEKLVGSYILGSWPFNVLLAVGLFRLRRLRPGMTRPFRTPWYPAVPAFFLVASGAMVINGIGADPMGAVTGSWMMLVGVPVYYLIRARTPDATR